MSIAFSLRHRQRGISLVELMIAMVLGLLLVAGIFRVYLSTQQSSQTTEALAMRQEAIRYVSARLAKDVRMAGYRGCLPDAGEIRNTLNPDPDDGARTEFTHTDFLYRFERYTEGFDAEAGGWSPELPSEIDNVVAGTDVLTLRASIDPEVFVIKEMPNTSADLKTNPLNPAPLADGDIVMITDCGGAAIFQITRYNLDNSPNSKGVNATYGNIVHNAGSGGGLPEPGNWTKDLGRRYPIGSQLIRIATISYFIRASANGTGPALWRDVDGEAVEIAEGVENLQIEYGEDTDGDRVADVYRSADAFADTAAWRRVVAVRAALLVAGTRNFAGRKDPRSFELLGTSAGPFDDGRLRRVVTLTFALRNRLP